MSVQQLGFTDSDDRDIEALHQLTAIYTKEHVVDDLLDRLNWPARPGRLLDPSCGDGAFLVAALKRIKTDPHDFANVARVQGWEIYPGAVREAQNRVKELLIERGWPASGATVAAIRSVRRGDFLMQPFERGEFSILTGNPPYLRWAGLPASFKGTYGVALPIHAKADLLHAFLDRCCAILPDDGVVGFVTADRWLFNETAGRLREILGKTLGVEHVRRLDPASSFYRPKQRTVGTPPRIHPVAIILSGDRRRDRPITRLPISPDDQVHIIPSTTLDDVAKISLAPWVGPHGIFVIDAKDIVKIKGARVIRAVDTEDIDRRTDQIGPPRIYVIITDPNQEPHGSVRAHLAKELARMPARGLHAPKWWLPPEPTNLDLSQPSLLIPRIARQLRVIRLPANVLPINHNLHIVATRFGASLDDLHRLLLSERSQDWITANAPRLEGGYLSITTRLLRRMPVT